MSVPAHTTPVAHAPGSAEAATAPVHPVAPKTKLNFPRVLTWIDPVASARSLVTILGLLYLAKYGNLFRLALRLSYWAIGLGVATEFITGKATGQKHGLVSYYKPSSYIPLSEATVTRFAQALGKNVVAAFDHVKGYLDVESLHSSFHAALFAFVLYHVTKVVSLWSLALTATVLAFAVPPVYLQFQQPIDEAIDVASDKVHSELACVQKQVETAAGPHIKTVKAQVAKITDQLGLTRGGFPVEADSNKVNPHASSTIDPSVQHTAKPVSAAAGGIPTNAKANTPANVAAHASHAAAADFKPQEPVKVAAVPVPVAVPVAVPEPSFPSVPSKAPAPSAHHPVDEVKQALNASRQAVPNQL
ncbi:Reticulon-like protein [Yarrowia sp. B02]|nr:Reticulon-like protein [Yarrowia sp. B02]